MKKFKAFGFAIWGIFAASEALANCDSVISMVGANYSNSFSAEDKRSFAVSSLCRNSSREKTAELEVFVKAIFVGFDGSDSSRNSFCSDNESFTVNQSASALLERKVFEPAVKAWESCKKLSGLGLDTRVNVSQNGELVSFYLRNLSTSNATFLGVATSPSNHIQCNFANSTTSIPEVDMDSRVDLSVGDIAMMDCKLAANANGIIPSTAINIRSSLDNFQIDLPELNQNPPEPDVIPKHYAVSLAGKPIRDQAWWANKTVGTGWMNCSRNVYGIPDDFDVVTISTRYEEWGRGHRQLPCNQNGNAFCDSAKEHCAAEYIEKGCAVNRDWHEWYKAYVSEAGVTYSKESVCSPS